MTYAHTDVVAAIRSLPQSMHIPDKRIHNWITKVAQLDDGKPLSFHVDRLFGVGGSESGSILAHYHDSASEAKLEDGFKSADVISREKLLLSTPFSTEYAERGTLIEPVIRDLFCRKYDLFDKADFEAAGSARNHAKNPYMKANTDDVFFKKKRILVDYKSTSKNSYKGVPPFTHACQLNHYAENMRSNGFAPDVCLTANLVAEESIFRDIINAFNNRFELPGDYEFWVNGILDERLTCAKLAISTIPSNKDFGGLISETINRFMNEYPLSGKTINSSSEETMLVGYEKILASKLEAKMFSVMTAERELKGIKETVEAEISEFSKQIGQPFAWPAYFPVAINFTKEFDKGAALEAVNLSGINTDQLYIQSQNTIDQEKLVQRFLEMGGELDGSLYTRKLDDERLQQAIKDAGLDFNDFVMIDAPVVRLSRKQINADQKSALGFELANALNDLIEETSNEEINQIEELVSQKNNVSIQQSM